ncbi:uncharacterized protein LOC123429883 [Hordeum vulgare subsp. vulgare]|uniref:uncharacterized protein LOC123429883 n=1 Tax=Hordeum vulgare subsp. vulgare TaxID=112509 RepID=UPI00162DD30D|nr:uncharacterized protein LOC123429883 [Hordeum vulgare subsp. vulgare]XP_044969794.1 uncharacterized protein LOC123429883 [Hordeum vulgare subsp. vulgare]
MYMIGSLMCALLDTHNYKTEQRHSDSSSTLTPPVGLPHPWCVSPQGNLVKEQVDRQDTLEEHRLLDAVKRVYLQHADLRWTFEFLGSYRAFQKLIKKVKRWKRHGRWKWNNIASTSRETSQVLEKLRYEESAKYSCYVVTRGLAVSSCYYRLRLFSRNYLGLKSFLEVVV